MLSRRPCAGHSIFGSLLLILIQQISVILSWNIPSFGRISAKVKPAAEVIREWNYDMHGKFGPLRWSSQYPECNWRTQSPVDLPNFPAASHYDCTLPVSLELLNYSTTVAGKLINNGVQLLYEVITRAKRSDNRPKLRSTFLDTDYILEKVIFHWGATSREGSEHTVKGNRFPFEIQFYHRPMQPKIIGRARHRVAIALLGGLKHRDNESLRPLVEFLPNIQKPGEDDEINMQWATLLPSEIIQQFYLYNGSYTSPPCNEDVTWIVLQARNFISEEQLKAFRGLYRTSPNLVNASRPIQALHERQIFSPCSAELEERKSMLNGGSGSLSSPIYQYQENTSPSTSVVTSSKLTNSNRGFSSRPNKTAETPWMGQSVETSSVGLGAETSKYPCASLICQCQFIYLLVLGFTRQNMLS